MIRVEGIRKVFNPHTRNANEVLKGVSFTLPDKGLVAIFGKSGSGKTTLLNIMGGLDKQDGGKIYIDNEDTSGKVDRIRNAKIGFIFQNYYLEAGYTISEIMRNAMLIAGFTDEKEIKERTEKVLKLVKLDRFKHKSADALSGGQKQRVAIARALIKGSDIILADEPTGNLDSENTTITMEILKEISKKQLVVLVTHEVNLIYKYADSHIKLVDGELKEDGELDKEIKIDVEKHNIYADEKEKRTFNIDKTNINVYGENNNNADIEIFNDDGSVYIRAGSGVQIIDNNSEKQVVFKGSEEEKFEVTESVPEFQKSTAKKNGKLFTFRNVWSRHYSGEEKAYSTGNIFKQIFIFVISVVMCFCSFFVFEAVNSKIITKDTDENNVYLDMKFYEEIRMLDRKLYDKIEFFELNLNDGVFAFANQQSMSQISVKYSAKSMDRDITAEEMGLEYGKMPGANEVLITRKLAEDLKYALRSEEYKTDDALLLLLFEKEYKISGIVKGQEPYVYMNRADYVNFLGVYKELKFIDSQNKFFEKDFTNKDTSETVNSYSAEICLYDGETLDLEINEAVVEINRSSTFMMMADNKDADYKIDSVNRLLLKTPQYISISNSNPTYIRHFNLNRDEMQTDIKVYVGEETLDDIFRYIAPNLDAFDKESDCFFEIITSGGEQLKNLNSYLKVERGINEIDIEKLYEYENREANNKLMSNVMIFVVIGILLFTIYYFIEKSGSIKNSKEYGIFRAIGINKSNLLFKETILTLKESIISYVAGYLIVMIMMAIRYSMMNIVIGGFIGISMGIMLLTGLIMVGISLIPYLFVLTKTPSEILSRYDI